MAVWGDYLMVVSFHYPIVGAPPAPPGPKPAHCTTTPQPCPSHPGRTFCASDKSPGQCDRPSVTKCPPCPPPPVPPNHCVPPAKPCKVHTNNCCGGPPPPPDGTTSWTAGQDGWIEWTAVPVPDMKGNYEQDVSTTH